MDANKINITLPSKSNAANWSKICNDVFKMWSVEMTDTTKQTERLRFVSAIQSCVTDLTQQYDLIVMYDEAIRKDLIAPIQAEPVAWQPIATAPRNNKRLLYLARFNDDGTIQELDYDGSWESDRESWEIPEVYYFWASANGIEEPTHWAYQDTPPPLHSADTRKLQLEAITKTLEVVYNEYENAGQNILDIDPEEILKGLTP